MNKQLAVNMAGAIDLIRNCDYTGMPTGAGQTVKMGEHHALLFDQLSAEDRRDDGGNEAKASDVAAKVDTPTTNHAWYTCVVAAAMPTQQVDANVKPFGQS